MADRTARVHAVLPGSSEAAGPPCCASPQINSACCLSPPRGSLAASNACSAEERGPCDKVCRGSLSTLRGVEGGCSRAEHVCRNGLFRRWFSWGRSSSAREQEGMQLARALLDQYAMKCHRRPSYAKQQPLWQAGNGNCQGLQAGASRTHVCGSTQAHTDSQCMMHPSDEVNKQTHTPWSSSHREHHYVKRAAPNTNAYAELSRTVCYGACRPQRLKPRQTSACLPARQQASSGHRCTGGPGVLAVQGSSCMHAGRAEDRRCRSEATECARGNVEYYDFPQQRVAPQRPCSVAVASEQEACRECFRCTSSAVPANAGHRQRAGSCCLRECLQRTTANENMNKQRAPYPTFACSSEAPSHRSPLQPHGHFTCSGERVDNSTSSAVPQHSQASMPRTAGSDAALERPTCAQNTTAAGGLGYSPTEQQQRQQLEILRLQQELLAERQARQEQLLLQQQQELLRQRREVEWNRQAAEAEAERRSVNVEDDGDYTADEEEEGWLTEDETDDPSMAALLHQSTKVSQCSCDNGAEHADCCGTYEESKAGFVNELSSDEATSYDYKKPRRSSRRIKWFRPLKTPR